LKIKRKRKELECVSQSRNCVRRGIDLRWKWIYCFESLFWWWWFWSCLFTFKRRIDSDDDCAGSMDRISKQKICDWRRMWMWWIDVVDWTRTSFVIIGSPPDDVTARNDELTKRRKSGAGDGHLIGIGKKSHKLRIWALCSTSWRYRMWLDRRYKLTSTISNEKSDFKKYFENRRKRRQSWWSDICIDSRVWWQDFNEFQLPSEGQTDPFW